MTWAHEKVTGSWAGRVGWQKVSGAWEYPIRAYRKITGTWTVIGRTRVTNPAVTAINAELSPTQAEATIGMNDNGTVNKTLLNGSSTTQNFLDKPETGVSQYYEMWMDENASSPLPTSALSINAGEATWISCDTNPTYQIQRSSVGVSTVDMDVQIREKAHTDNIITSLWRVQAAVDI